MTAEPYAPHLYKAVQCTILFEVNFKTASLQPGFRIRIRINLSCWIRIRIQEEKNYPKK
jgi:hypothetical protein